jgi:hypothetical protein
LNLPFDLAQGGESFDFAQDREPAERLVEPFSDFDIRYSDLFRMAFTPKVGDGK